MKKLMIILMVGLFVLFGKRSALALSSAISIPSPTPTVGVDYALPYPGILPDHPLYFIKVIRDRVLGFLINDPIKKVEFELLMADKRIKMAQILFDSGKYDLSLTTVSKSEKYLNQAVDNFVTARKTNRVGTANLSDRLMQATLKHKEIITMLMSKVTSRQNEWQETVTFPQRNIELLNSVK